MACRKNENSHACMHARMHAARAHAHITCDMHGVSGLSRPYQLQKPGRGRRELSRYSFSHHSSIHAVCGLLRARRTRSRCSCSPEPRETPSSFTKLTICSYSSCGQIGRTLSRSLRNVSRSLGTGRGGRVSCTAYVFCVLHFPESRRFSQPIVFHSSHRDMRYTRCRSWER